MDVKSVVGSSGIFRSKIKKQKETSIKKQKQARYVFVTKNGSLD